MRRVIGASLEGSSPESAATARLVRARVASQLYDESGAEAYGTAIYTLSDPRELRAVRYVGQTRAPRRRWLQHVRTARLWIPDELPWWVLEPRHRPLYEWIRALFRDERRLPVMIVTAWHGEREQATLAERRSIQEHLRREVPLLNVELAELDSQIPLF